MNSDFNNSRCAIGIMGMRGRSKDYFLKSDQIYSIFDKNYKLLEPRSSVKLQNKGCE
jgi:hypothetical protein